MSMCRGGHFLALDYDEINLPFAGRNKHISSSHTFSLKKTYSVSPTPAITALIGTIPTINLGVSIEWLFWHSYAGHDNVKLSGKICETWQPSSEIGNVTKVYVRLPTILLK